MIKKIYKYLSTRLIIKMDPVKYARKIGVEIGKNSRLLGIQPSTFGSEPYLIKIGNHVTITGGVKFITHDGGVWILREEHPEIDVFGTIEIGDNSFIGLNTIILPNVKIGENCVVGAGSVVTKNVPDNSVVAGVPARKICDTRVYKQRSLEKAHFIKSMSKEEKKSRLVKDLKK